LIKINYSNLFCQKYEGHLVGIHNIIFVKQLRGISVFQTDKDVGLWIKKEFQENSDKSPESAYLIKKICEGYGEFQFGSAK